MKKNVLKLTIIASLALVTFACKNEKKNETTAAEAAEVKAPTEVSTKYTAVPSESIINWVGSKPTGSHTGTITIKSGEFNIKDNAIESGNFTIDMNSITVTDLEPGDGKENLEAHLKGNKEGKEDHFFNVKEYPTAAFEITGLSQKEGKSMLEGNLTIKGVKKNIAFPVSVSLDDNGLTLTSEDFTINRTEWNVNYGSKSIFDDLGDRFINDDIELKISVKAQKG